MRDGIYIVNTRREILYWNAAAEQISGYDRTSVVGRMCQDTGLRHINQCGDLLCRGQCPLVQTMSTGQPCSEHVFLHHAHGQRVPIIVHAAPLFDEEQHVIGATEVFHVESAPEAQDAELQLLRAIAYTDPLTEIGNRRYGEQLFGMMLSDYERYQIPCGILIADIDHFKCINDTLGHDIGDQVLRMVARTLAGTIRDNDIVCRWGGEEFVIGVRSATDLMVVGERLRTMIEESFLVAQHTPVTISLGGTVARSGDTLDAIFRRADQALFQSKREGRNRATIV